MEWRELPIQALTGDRRDAGARRHLLAGAQAVVHLAGLIKAPDAQAFMAINRDATRALAQSIRDHAPEATTFCISSLAAREPALSAYARSKRAGKAETGRASCRERGGQYG